MVHQHLGQRVNGAREKIHVFLLAVGRRNTKVEWSNGFSGSHVEHGWGAVTNSSFCEAPDWLSALATGGEGKQRHLETAVEVLVWMERDC